MDNGKKDDGLFEYEPFILDCIYNGCLEVEGVRSEWCFGSKSQFRITSLANTSTRSQKLSCCSDRSCYAGPEAAFVNLAGSGVCKLKGFAQAQGEGM